MAIKETTPGQALPSISEHSRGLDALLLIGIAAALVVTWQASLWTPLKILVVFFHEASHALTAIVTGGSVERMEIVPNQGGSVLSRGGNAFLIVTAGYLGSLLIGATLLVIAARSRLDRWIMGALAISIALLTLLFMRNLYGIAFGALGALLMLISAYFFSERVNDFLLRLIGLTSMIYVPLDIYSDTLARPHLHSDARILASLIGGTPQFWGLIWLALALLLIALALWLSFRPRRP
jgi:hypothetical protein